MALNESNYITMLQVKDTIIENKDLIFKQQKKKGNKKAIKYGVGGVVLGIIIKSLFN